MASKNSSKEVFEKKSRERFGDRFDYSKLEYSNHLTQIQLICPKHGLFTILPGTHLNSTTGCQRCSIENSHNEQRGTNESFIEKAKKRYGDKYDYSLVEYIGAHNKVKIVCKEHGVFEKTPASHLYGNGECRQCYRKIAKYKKNTQNEILERFKKVHSDRYDYSEFVYLGYHEKSKIICKKHGPFLLKPAKHCSGSGCQECARLNLNKWKTSTNKGKIKPFSEFVSEANEVHSNKFQYNESSYIKTYDIVEISCPKHGSFKQLGSNHLSGHGCPKCASSISFAEESIVKFLKSLNIDAEIRNRSIIAPLELDIFIASKKIAIEYNGIYWHSELFGKNRTFHLNKTNSCCEKGIRLIHIFENEFENSPRVVFSKLKSILGLIKRKIYARKCEVRVIDKDTKRKFINKYHLQGDTLSFINLGLFYKNHLVSVMTFCRNRISLGQEVGAGRYELARFCSVFNFNIVGGAGKLLSFFEKNYAPKHIITYADLRWSVGNLYYKLGFSLKNQSHPNYWYFKKVNLYHRFGFRKNILKRKLENFDPNLTEWENMQNHGWNRIWDCGCLVFEKKYE